MNHRSEAMSRRMRTTLCVILLSAAFQILLPQPCAAAQKLEIIKKTLRFEAYPKDAKPLIICHMTDFHFDKDDTGLHKQIKEALEREKPDVIALTGDYADKPEKAFYFVDFIKAFKAPLGVFSVFGNWEYWRGIAPYFRDEFPAQGITVINNTAAQISGTVWIAGVDDMTTEAADLRAALTKVPPRVFTLLLSHCPGIFDDPLIHERGVSLVLSGHTHGGQVRLPLIGELMLPKASGHYVKGFYEAGKSVLFVSKGIGKSSGAPRLNCPPDIAFITVANNP